MQLRADEGADETASFPNPFGTPKVQLAFEEAPRSNRAAYNEALWRVDDSTSAETLVVRKNAGAGTKGAEAVMSVRQLVAPPPGAEVKRPARKKK